MKRSAADFAAEARKEELYELTLADGTVVHPRSTHDLSYDENLAQDMNSVRWFRWHRENPDRQAPPGTKVDEVEIVSPDELNFRTRFGEHYDAWWAEWRDLPRGWITKLLIEIDRYYDPTPASTQEQNAMAGGDADAAGKSGGAAT